MRTKEEITLDYHKVRTADLPATERLFIAAQLHLEALLDIRDILTPNDITTTGDYAFPPQGDPSGDETPLTEKEYNQQVADSHNHP